MQKKQSHLQRIIGSSLVLQILIGIVAGVALAIASPSSAETAGFLGSLFC